MSYDTIKKYYDYTLPLYRIFYHKQSNALHFGFWDDTVSTHQEALLNVNKYMANKARIVQGDRILDAGCGIGGSTMWLAENYDIEAVGITISDRQVRKAKYLAKEKGLQDRAIFYKKDYIDTDFEDESFTVVWAIESVCHTVDKKDFIKEAYRLLRPGGRLIVDDGFLLRDPENDQEAYDLDSFLEGMAVPNLARDTEFHFSLIEAGFKNVSVENKVKDVMASSERIHKLSTWSYPLSKWTERLRLTPSLLTKNNLAGITQYRIIKNGIMGHRVFYAEK